MLHTYTHMNAKLDNPHIGTLLTTSVVFYVYKIVKFFTLFSPKIWVLGCWNQFCLRCVIFVRTQTPRVKYIIQHSSYPSSHQHAQVLYKVHTKSHLSFWCKYENQKWMLELQLYIEINSTIMGFRPIYI